MQPSYSGSTTIATARPKQQMAIAFERQTLGQQLMEQLRTRLL
jgi:hypothetical protein